MRYRSSCKLRLGVLALWAAFAAAGVGAAPLYRITVIPAVPDQVPAEGSTYASSINDRGVVLGAVRVKVAGREVNAVYRWSAADGVELMPFPDKAAAGASAAGVDARGRAHAAVWGDTGDRQVVSWDRHQRLRRISPREPGVSHIPYTVNARGDVVGEDVRGGGTIFRAMLWSADGATIDLGVEGAATAVTDGGIVAGNFDHHDGTAQPFIWTADRGATILGRFPGDEGDGTAQTTDINEGGVIVGWGTKELFYSKQVAFRWSQAEGYQLLDAPQCRSTHAYAINTGGIVVGDCRLRDGSTVSYLWAPHEGASLVIDLLDPSDPLAARLQSIALNDINASGMLAGSAQLDGSAVSIVLTPVE